ncbi:hypothetical protein [Streptomyces tauricus]|uniref:hypothetical protein n=1 Tax=Streptomyces tauricus TaxID=68274 RepID=UPI0034434F44
MSTHTEPMRSPALDALILDAGGAALPDHTPDEPHFAELMAECAALLDGINFVKTSDKLVALASWTAEGPKITYDPAFSAEDPHTEDAPFRTACILHEIMHVSVDNLYEPHPQPAERKHWRSFNFHYTSSAGEDFDKQCTTASDNLLKIQTRAGADPTLDPALRGHINGRIEYGLPSSHTHYDTILLDLLVYLRVKGHTSKNTFFAYLTKLSQQARTHRLDPKHGPVPVAPET